MSEMIIIGIMSVKYHQIWWNFIH